jgi:hypothetical protein
VSRTGHVHAQALRAIAEGLQQAAAGLARLASEAETDVADVYTSAHPPPEMSRRQFARKCRDLALRGEAGVHRNGRIWVAPRVLFDERAPMLTVHATRPTVQTAAKPAAMTSRSWSAADALHWAGARRGEP